MSTRFTDESVVYQKCADSQCANEVRRTPHEIRKGTSIYCSNKCRVANMKPTRYTPELVAKIKAFDPKTPLLVIAQKLDLSHDGFRKWVALMKKADPEFPFSLPPRKKEKPPKPEKPKKTYKKPNPERKGKGAGTHVAPRRYIDQNKPALGNKGRWKEKKVPDRVIVDGPVKIFFLDKNKTKFSARDQAHVDKILKAYGHLGDYKVVGA